jgi:hypothetical protein
MRPRKLHVFEAQGPGVGGYRAGIDLGRVIDKPVKNLTLIS